MVSSWTFFFVYIFKDLFKISFRYSNLTLLLLMAESSVPEKQTGLGFDEDGKTSKEKNEYCPKLERVTKRKGVDITGNVFALNILA